MSIKYMNTNKAVFNNVTHCSGQIQCFVRRISTNLFLIFRWVHLGSWVHFITVAVRDRDRLGDEKVTDKFPRRAGMGGWQQAVRSRLRR